MPHICCIRTIVCILGFIFVFFFSTLGHERSEYLILLTFRALIIFPHISISPIFSSFSFPPAENGIICAFSNLLLIGRALEIEGSHYGDAAATVKLSFKQACKCIISQL